MAYTVLVLTDPQGDGLLSESVLFISEEYSPTKERDASGAILPDQEWQHPAPEGLQYCKFGNSSADARVNQHLKTLLSLGVGQLGGHVRMLYLAECSWLKCQTENWENRHAHEAKRLEAEQRRELEPHLAELREREPIYDYCGRCRREMEQCKGASHRGPNKCIQCCGGVGNPNLRHCRNCLDLPYREKREEALGHPIVYAGEDPIS
jgi:hypothetical protein